MAPWRRWLQLRARSAGRRIDEREERGWLKQWFLLLGLAPGDARTAPAPQRLQPLYPPDGAFWADPFLWARGGRGVVFFEEFPFQSGRGRISALEIDAQACPVGEAFVVLDAPVHLSYPFLFEHDGELYMLPEKREARRLDLYRCVEFPRRWVLERTLMDGLELVDANLYQHEGRWWILCAGKARHSRINETLLGFYADHPFSRRWTPHPANPLVRDFRSGRPGGRLFSDASGRLFRPTQDCVRRYGHGLGISEITELSTRTFRERQVWYASGPDAGGWRAMHHMDWHAGIMAMDAQRLLPARIPGLPMEHC